VLVGAIRRGIVRFLRVYAAYFLLITAIIAAGYGIEVGGGVGQYAGRMWRVGCMGHTARPANVTLLLGALEELLSP